jgi:N-acetylneuraminate lyase
MPAVATPFRSDGAVDLAALARLVERYLDKGVEGLFVCGTGGEGLLLSLTERRAVAETAIRAAAGRIPVVVHAGAVNTADTVALARHAEEAGAAVVSAIPPVYFAYCRDAIVQHYRTVMDATGLPMVLYNIPSLTGIEFTADSTELLGDPRVVGVKHTSTDLASLARMAAAYPGKAILCGFDDLFVPALACGAAGAIGVTVGPCFELFAAARACFRAGQMSDAVHLQSRLSEVLRTLFACDLYPAAKYLAERDGVPLGDCRPPFLPLTAESRAVMDALGDQLDAWIPEAAAMFASRA